MKPYYLFFLLLVGGLIFATVKTPKTEEPQRQEEQAAPETEEVSQNIYKIRYELESDNDQPVADILWMQKAAELAMDKDIPWFNVLEQKLNAGSIEGVIQLEKDPMKAEYDANEILSLQLTNQNPDNL